MLNDSSRLAERDRLKLCECDWLLLSDMLAERVTLMLSCKLPDFDMEAECETLMLSCRLADLLMLLLCETLADSCRLAERLRLKL